MISIAPKPPPVDRQQQKSRRRVGPRLPRGADRSAAGRRAVIVLAGALAQRPGYGGHTWVFLQYLLGFRRLGWDVLFLDRLEPDQCVDQRGEPCPVEDSVNWRYLRDTMRQFGLGNHFALLTDHGRRWLGLPRGEVLEHAADAELLLNVMGFLDDEEILAAVPRRVFLDIDPGFGQMWRALRLHDPFAGHDAFVTVGENIGRPDCVIPTCGLDWITSPQPVVLEHWPADGAGGPSITGVCSWRGPNDPVDYEGVTYGLRVHEFRKFAALPRLTGRRFELALDIHPAEKRDLSLLRGHGWALADPDVVAGDPSTYQAYIQGSAAELMVAKGMYVQTRSGWLSDRSLCYLASGKPVIAQDTGLAGRYPTGKGLLTFSDLEEAVAAVEELSTDYDNHAQAARALAEERFDSDKVLVRLLAAVSGKDDEA